MPLVTETVTFRMFSSASDVWSAVTAATAVFPMAMPNLYAGIKRNRRDGFTEGSIRDITFGPAYSRVVGSGREEILEVDHSNMTVKTTMNDDGAFVPRLFDSVDITTAVVPSSRANLRATGCTITWSFTYDSAKGNADVNNLKNVMQTAFQDLDDYLRRGRGNRP
ncbi:unnamed protein product [Linum tenue]|uniref:Uncharacterized protein n=2 Tax=Linum tenue TaxID=586396 RepID=A0AAV0HMQ3_9ROSI|nr:unnamed protein product [Linum tenue]